MQNYDSIDWSTARNNVASVDLYNPHSWFLDGLNSILHAYEKFHMGFLRETALNQVLDHIRQEDENTDCIGIGPVSKAINLVVRFYADGPKSESFQRHIFRVQDYLW